MIRICQGCGPYKLIHSEDICPRCGMDDAAYRYRAIIMELGGAEVYRRETLGLPLR